MFCDNNNDNLKNLKNKWGRGSAQYSSLNFHHNSLLFSSLYIRDFYEYCNELLIGNKSLVSQSITSAVAL